VERFKTPHTLMRGREFGMWYGNVNDSRIDVTPPGRVPAMFFDNWG